MAKLSAHGKELARVEKIETKGDTTTRSTLALFEDGWILYKANFTSLSTGLKHGGSWSRFGRLMEHRPTPAIADRWAYFRGKQGYTRVSV